MLTLNSQIHLSLCLLSARIKGKCQHTQLFLFFFFFLNFQDMFSDLSQASFESEASFGSVYMWAHTYKQAQASIKKLS